MPTPTRIARAAVGEHGTGALLVFAETPCYDFHDNSTAAAVAVALHDAWIGLLEHMTPERRYTLHIALREDMAGPLVDLYFAAGLTSAALVDTLARKAARARHAAGPRRSSVRGMTVEHLDTTPDGILAMLARIRS